MIRSITFPKQGQGYLYETPKKPTKPLKSDWRYRHTEFGNKDNGYKISHVFDQEEYDADLAEYKEKNEFYKKNKGKFICPASRNLVDKTFEFDSNKINIIFGPNGSGETTILNTIVGSVLIEDGLPELGSYGDIIGYKFSDPTVTEEKVQAYIDKKRKNTAILDWDGQIIYYDNFGHTLTHSGHSIGDLCGSLFSNIMEEVTFIIGRDQISTGQMSSYLFNKLYKIISNLPTMKEYLEKRYKHDLKDVVDSRSECIRFQIDYVFANKPGYDKKDNPTVLLDELDKSLDIETVWRLYNVILPAIQKEFGIQFILISHNPLVMTKTIRESKYINFISIDEEYTEDIKKLLGGEQF